MDRRRDAASLGGELEKWKRVPSLFSSILVLSGKLNTEEDRPLITPVCGLKSSFVEMKNHTLQEVDVDQFTPISRQNVNLLIHRHIFIYKWLLYDY